MKDGERSIEKILLYHFRWKCNGNIYFIRYFVLYTHDA